jgi:predicted phage terminase large subunit-like protein
LPFLFYFLNITIKLTNKKRGLDTQIIKNIIINNYFFYCKYICENLFPFISFEEKWLKAVIFFCDNFYKDQNTNNAILNAPPGIGKSTAITRIFSTWLIGKHPERKIFIISSNEEALSDCESVIGGILKSNCFTFLFEDFELSEDKKFSKKTNQNGFIKLKKSRSDITGSRGHYFFFDDFFKPTHTNRKESQTSKDFLKMYLGRNELNPQTKRIIVEQRISHEDTTAILNKQWSENNIPFYHLSFKFFYKKRESLSFFGKKIIFNENEFIDNRFSKKYMKEIIATQGGVIFETQYQQNPPTGISNIIKKEWLLFEKEEVLQNMQFQEIYLSLDTAFKEGEHNDPTCIGVFGIFNKKIYLLEIFKKKMEYPYLKKFTLGVINQYKPNAVLIEDKASGQSLIQELKTTASSNIIGIKVKGDKVERLITASIFFEAQNFIICQKEWSFDFEQELLSFPFSKHDDQVDCVSQFLNWYKNKNKTANLNNFYSAMN